MQPLDSKRGVNAVFAVAAAVATVVAAVVAGTAGTAWRVAAAAHCPVCDWELEEKCGFLVRKRDTGAACKAAAEEKSRGLPGLWVNPVWTGIIFFCGLYVLTDRHAFFLNLFKTFMHIFPFLDEENDFLGPSGEMSTSVVGAVCKPEIDV